MSFRFHFRLGSHPKISFRGSTSIALQWKPLSSNQMRSLHRDYHVLASGRRILPPRSTAYIFPHIVVRNQQKSKKEVKITTAAESKEQNDVTTNQNTTTPTSPSCDPEVIFATIGLLFFGLPLLAGLLIWIVWIIKNTYDLIVEILNCSEQETTNQPSRPSVGRKRGGWYHL